jgi:hypothetical protein
MIANLVNRYPGLLRSKTLSAQVATLKGAKTVAVGAGAVGSAVEGGVGDNGGGGTGAEASGAGGAAVGCAVIVQAAASPAMSKAGPRPFMVWDSAPA